MDFIAEPQRFCGYCCGRVRISVSTSRSFHSPAPAASVGDAEVEIDCTILKFCDPETPPQLRWPSHELAQVLAVVVVVSFHLRS